jgi:hypothetical protein
MIITKLPKGIWQIWESTSKPKYLYLKPQHVKLLAQNFFSIKRSNKCVMDDESYFNVEGNKLQVWKSPSNCVANVLLWLAVSVNGVSVVNKELYISICLPVLQKFVFWPDLTYAHYANDILARLEELNINTFQRNKIHQTSHSYGWSNMSGLI